MEELILTKRFNITGTCGIDIYIQSGGYRAARKALLEGHVRRKGWYCQH